MFTTSAGPASPRRTTALTRALGLALVAAIAFATLYPLTDWRLRTDGALSFLGAGLPRYWTGFDVTSNFVAYLLLGVLLTLGWLTRTPALAAFASVTVAGSLLSLSLEAAQSYLPGRVPSLLDWLANTAGVAAGGALGVRLAHVAGGRPGADRAARWYEHGPPSGWLLLLLWLSAQLVPQRLLFATGHAEPLLQRLLDRLALDEPIDLSLASAWLPGGAGGGAGLGVAIEAATVVCAVCTIGALVFALVRTAAERAIVLGGVALVAFALRSLATQAVYGPGSPLAWLTPGAQGGLVVGMVLLYGIETLGARARAAIAMLAAIAGALLVNLAPEDRYFETMFAGGPGAGPLSNLHGLLRAASVAWPLLAVAWFWVRLRDGEGRSL
jgi:VanZ family protein